MDACSLEGMRQRHLTVDLLWPERAVTKYKFAWANSTRGQYNKYIVSCHNFCVENDYTFPLPESAILAEFLCHLTEKSKAPCTIIRGLLSALDLVYKAQGVYNPSQSVEIKNLCTALIKSGTSQPLLHNTVMPMKPFITMFESWGPNENVVTQEFKNNNFASFNYYGQTIRSGTQKFFSDNKEHSIVLSTKHVT